MSFFNEFNADDYQGNALLQPGEYRMVCTEINMCDTKAGDGKYLKCAFEVVEGESSGQMIWDNFNVENPKPKAQDVGRRQFANFCRAIGVLRPRHPEEVLNIPFNAEVKIEEDKTGNYQPQNKIKKFIDGSGSAGGARANIQPSASVAPAKKPWQR